MRTIFLTSALALGALSAAPALAQQPCQRDNTGRIVGTVAGGGAGALLGSTIAGEGDKRLGAVIGAVGGAILGNQVTKGSGKCEQAFGYFDSQGRWNATNVSAENARGYYNRDGRWIEGVPNGYYDAQGRWIAARNGQQGYRDRDGHWVPASAPGYYDSRNRWVEAQTAGAQGYYDRDGRWVASQQSGYYDSNGRWVAGQQGGYYDANGRWVAAGYTQNGVQNGQRDLRVRYSNMQERIERQYRNGRIDAREYQRATAELNAIMARDARLRSRNGTISQRNETALASRLDRLGQALREARDAG